MTFHLMSVLAIDLPTWVALGWREVARERNPSVHCDCVLVRNDDPNPRTP